MSRSGQPILDLAIVLRATRFEERHLIVTGLTQNHGKITAMAKNAVHSRRFGGTLSLFAASEWTLSRRPGAELYHLSETHLRRSYEGLSRDLHRLGFASACTELCLKVLSPEHPVPEIFKLHAQALSLFENATDEDELLPLFNATLLQWLLWTGHRPRLDRCVICDQALEAHRSFQPEPTLAGLRCPQCVDTPERLTLSYAAWIDALNAGHLPLSQILAHRQGRTEDHQVLFEYLKLLSMFHIAGMDGFLKSLDTLNGSELLGQSIARHPTNPPPQNPPLPA